MSTWGNQTEAGENWTVAGKKLDINMEKPDRSWGN
jgi:hypothetical protein